jgi:fucose 4-O-acetylase-like acetyltransferase
MNSQSLISRDASTAIKGLLMLLIVFGHTGMLTTDFATGNRTFFWHWLYTFHVYAFFVLPFIYGYKRNPVSTFPNKGQLIDYRQVGNDLKRNLIQIGVPYCWFFVLAALVFVTVGGGEIHFGGMIYAFFFGTEPLLKKYIGFYVVWFLPSMLAVQTLKSVWYNSKKAVRICILVISIVLWVLTIFIVLTKSALGKCVPFSLSHGFYFLLLGLISRWVIEKQFPSKLYWPFILFLVLVLIVLLYLQSFLQWHPMLDYYTIMCLAMPVLMFLVLYGFRNVLSKSRLLLFLGKYSLQIYIVHVFVLNALDKVFTHLLKPSIGLGIVIYILALAISAGLAVVMVKVPIIKKLMFPKYEKS